MRRYFLQKKTCARERTPAHFYYVNMYVHNQHFMTNYEFTPWFMGRGFKLYYEYVIILYITSIPLLFILNNCCK